MSRVIKFKGVGINSSAFTEKNEWVYGSLLIEDYETDPQPPKYYINQDKTWIRVDPNTVCQYTGENGIKGVEIYEGDLKKDSHGNLWVVKFSLGMFVMKQKGKNFAQGFRASGFEVIGNIHDKEEVEKI